jgi:hypothetical protein
MRQLPVIGKTPNAISSGASLPLPSIGRKMVSGPPTPGSNARGNQIAASNLTQDVQDGEEQPAAGKFQISEEEAERLQKERLTAKAKAAATKTFHKAHK